MDLQSLWLTNRRLLDTMQDIEYKYKENDIVESLFGGTKNMIKLILKNKNNLSYIQQNQLLKILKKTPPTKSNKNNSNTKRLTTNDQNKHAMLPDLNEHCLSHIFQFLDKRERQAFSTTARNICIASKMKNSYPNSDVLDFPFKKLNHFIHKISELKNINQNENNLLKLAHETELFCVWLKNEVPYHGVYFVDIMAESGLLPFFSDLLINTNIINNYLTLIKDVLFLFKIHSNITSHIVYLLNVSIISNLTLLTENIMYKNQMFIQNAIIPQIVRIFANLFFDDNAFQSAVHTKMFESKIIEHIITILQQPWSTKNCKNLKWIVGAMSLVEHWIYKFPDQYESLAGIILKDIVPQFINKISNLIDVKYSKTWVYQLLSKEDTIILRDPNEFNWDDPDSSYFFRFKISEISALPDTNAMITLIGKFTSYHYTNPNQKLVVPVDHIHFVKQMIEKNQDNMYRLMLQTLQALCNLLLAFNRCYGPINFRLNQHKQTINCIKNILQTAQTQFSKHFKRAKYDILLTLLKTDWAFFMEFISNEIETQFTRLSKEKLYGLIDVAWECNDLHNLCQMQWFRANVCDVTHMLYFINCNHEFPKHWGIYIFIELVKHFYDDYETYPFLSGIVAKIEFEHNELAIQYFVNLNGVSWLLKIIGNSCMNSIPISYGVTNDVRVLLLTNCKDILSDIFIYLPDATFLRKECLKLLDEIDDECTSMIKQLWWLILETALMQNKNNKSEMKLVLQELNWFIHQYEIQSNTNNHVLMELLLELQTQYKFQDKEIMTYLQNIISYIS